MVKIKSLFLALWERWIIKEREFGGMGNFVFYSWCLLTIFIITLFLMLYFRVSALNGSVHSITSLSGVMRRGK